MADPSTKTSTHKSSKKVANSLLSLSSAAVLAIYAAGYERTQSAAEELEAASANRRPSVPSPQRAGAPPRAVAGAPVAAPPAPTAVASETARVDPAPDAPPAPPSPAPAAFDEPAPVAMPKANGGKPAATPAPAAKPATLVADAAAASIPAASAPVTVGGAAPVEAPAAPTTASAAPAAAVTAAPAPAPALPKYKDGTYRAWGRSRHGDIYSFVVVENGRIVHSGVDKCRTRWSCDLVAHLGPQVVQRQVAEVDYVSGATESGNAFYYGVLEALNMAQGLTPVDPANEIK